MSAGSPLIPAVEMMECDKVTVKRLKHNEQGQPSEDLIFHVKRIAK